MVDIRDLSAADDRALHAAADVLVRAFRDGWPGHWPDRDAGLEEVREALAEDRICRAAFDRGELVGWVGGLPQYDGHVWELHPLAVDPSWQRRGIGAALVRDFEAQVAARGGLTITLGSDDETGMTSLSGVDLYDDLWRHVQSIRNLRGHPYTFYQRLGFTITGVVPDANGPGKPDILMCKRVEVRGG